MSKRSPELLSVFSGENSSMPSEKLSFGSVLRLNGLEVKDGELVQLGGSGLDFDITEAEEGSIYLLTCYSLLVVFYIKTVATVRNQYVGVVDSFGVVTDIANFAEFRAPSLAVAPDRMFVTFGDNVHCFDPSGGTLVTAADMGNSSDTTAIAFGGNRVHRISGRVGQYSDKKAGGLCTTFATGSAENEAGQYDGETKENYTNIKYVSEKVVLFAPNIIEVKVLTKEEFSDGSTGTTSIKKIENYGKKENVGTATFRELPQVGSTVYFFDEVAKQLYAMVPEKDTNNQIAVDPIDVNKRNFEEDFEYEYWTGSYSSTLQQILFSVQRKNSAVNDTVILFNPVTGDFSRKNWSTNNFVEKTDGTLLFAKSDGSEVNKYLPDSIFDEDVILPMEIEFNTWSDPMFWRKQRWKKLAFWFKMSATTTVSLLQSLNGSEYVTVKLNLDLPVTGGVFSSPRNTLGRGVAGMPSLNTVDKALNVIIGKLRTRAKGSTVQFKLVINSDEKFRLKDLALPDSRIGSSRRKETFQNEVN